jgi:DNA-binding protein H-NS
MAKAKSEGPAKRGGRKGSAQSPSVETGTGHGIDLSGLDRETLIQLRRDVETSLQSYDKRRRDEALREMQAVAEKHGVSFKDLVRGDSSRSANRPKYRSPENSELTWTGRGRQPSWFKEAVESGRRPDELLIG